MQDIPWERGTVVLYRGQIIHAIEENGRGFWAVTIPDPSGWSLRQEFSFTSEAMRYIDERLGVRKVA